MFPRNEVRHGSIAYSNHCRISLDTDGGMFRELVPSLFTLKRCGWVIKDVSWLFIGFGVREEQMYQWRCFNVDIQLHAKISIVE